MCIRFIPNVQTRLKVYMWIYRKNIHVRMGGDEGIYFYKRIFVGISKYIDLYITFICETVIYIYIYIYIYIGRERERERE